MWCDACDIRTNGWGRWKIVQYSGRPESANPWMSFGDTLWYIGLKASRLNDLTNKRRIVLITKAPTSIRKDLHQLQMQYATTRSYDEMTSSVQREGCGLPSCFSKQAAAWGDSPPWCYTMLTRLHNAKVTNIQTHQLHPSISNVQIVILTFET